MKHKRQALKFLEDNACMINSLMSKKEQIAFHGDVVSIITKEIKNKLWNLRRLVLLEKKATKKKMKVYELIQKLSRYDADTEVKFHVKADFDTDVDAEFDRDNEDDVQTVTVTAGFDEDVDYDGIKDNEASICNPNITIELVY